MVGALLAPLILAADAVSMVGIIAFYIGATATGTPCRPAIFLWLVHRVASTPRPQRWSTQQREA